VRTQRRKSPLLTFVAGIAGLFLVVPLASVALRVPWRSSFDLLGSSMVQKALFISVSTSMIATACVLVFGVPLAYWLSRNDSIVARIVRVLAVSPIVLPPVVGGIALLAAFGRRGVVGQWLNDWFGVSLPFTRTAIVLAQVFVAMPFLVLSVESAFRQAGTALDDAARTLGAGPLRIFLRVSLPSVLPAVGAGAVLSWARAFGEFGASITFAGSLSGRTQTLPMAVYELATVEYSQALVVSLFMIVVSVGILVGLRDRWLTGGSR
jgi:molybdate transport system permease protein